MKEEARKNNRLGGINNQLLYKYLTNESHFAALEIKTFTEVATIAQEALGFPVTKNNVYEQRKIATGCGDPLPAMHTARPPIKNLTERMSSVETNLEMYMERTDKLEQLLGRVLRAMQDETVQGVQGAKRAAEILVGPLQTRIKLDPDER